MPPNAARRVVPFVQSIGAVVACVVIVDAALSGLTSLDPEWLPHRFAGTGFVRDIDQRVAAASMAYATGEVPSDAPLVVLLGLSNLREGVDLNRLSSATGLDARYLGLCGAGGVLNTMIRQCESLLASDLRPALAIIGTTEFLPVDPVVVYAESEASRSNAPSPAPSLRDRLRSIANLSWLRSRRGDLRMAAEDEFATMHFALVRAIGDASARNPLTDPWREMIRLGLPESVTDQARATQLAAYEGRGLFDPSAYEHPSVTAELEGLGLLIDSLRERGSEVVVVLLPESTALRDRIPAIAVDRFREAIATRLPRQDDDIVDLRAFLDDDGFADISHPNSVGRLRLSDRLSELIRDRMPVD
jgi:hypothetical protein